VWATAIVWAAFALGVHQPVVGSALLTLYLTWSPWHYSGQNYGIAMMFLRRRGVPITMRARRLLHASFAVSFALTAVAFHSPQPDVAYAPGDYERSIYRIVPLGAELGVPYEVVVQVVVPVLLAAYLLCLGGGAIALRRAAPWRDLLPALVLAASQALWFTIPMLARYAGVLQGIEPLGTEQATYAFLWVAVAHSVQYVWITSYYARRTSPGASPPRYLLQTLLAGALIWVVPSALFAPGLLGSVPFDAGLGALVAAAVNIHHFVLDGAIWKLRDGAIARVLLRPAPPAAAGGAARRPSVAAWSVWALGAAAVVVLAWTPFEEVQGNRAAERGDLARLETAHRRLSWLGRESALTHATMAVALQRNGDLVAAERHARAAQRLAADWGALGNLGVYFQAVGRDGEAIAAIERAWAQRPDSAKLCNQLAQLLLVHRQDDEASRARAVQLAERAVELTDPVNPRYLATLAMAYRGAGRQEEASEIEQRGIAATQPGTAEGDWFRREGDRN
jgi:hypothetical protein